MEHEFLSNIFVACGNQHVDDPILYRFHGILVLSFQEWDLMFKSPCRSPTQSIHCDGVHLCDIGYTIHFHTLPCPLQYLVIVSLRQLTMTILAQYLVKLNAYPQCSFQAHSYFQCFHLSGHLQLCKGDSYMWEESYNKPFSMLCIRDVKCQSIQQDHRPLIIVSCHFSHMMFYLFNLYNAM